MVVTSFKKEQKVNDALLKIVEDYTSIFFEKEQDISLCLRRANKSDSNLLVSIRTKGQVYEKSFFMGFDLECPEKYDKQEILNIVNVVIKGLCSQSTCDHQYESVIDEYGTPMPNGLVKCSICQHKTIDKNLIDKKIVVAQDSLGKPYVCQKAWPEKTFVQSGGSGLVIKSPDKIYRTAFVEAFPKIGIYGTCFIRGEGENKKLAEEMAWEKYLRYINCEEHDFTREYKGKERVDGYALCKKCGMSGTFLEPLTKCKVCNKPTNEKFDGDFLCSTHYFEMDKSETIKREIEMANEVSKRFNDEDCPKETELTEKLEYEVLSYFFHEAGEEEYLEYKESILRIVWSFEGFIIDKAFGIKPFADRRNVEFPSFENETFQESLNYFKKNINEIYKLIKEKRSVPYDLFILPKYNKKVA